LQRANYKFVHRGTTHQTTNRKQLLHEQPLRTIPSEVRSY